MTKLSADYYRQTDVVALAKNLLGKHLVTDLDGIRTVGKIVETEAYSGSCDKACHAWLYKRTERTQIFFEPGGLAYVYLCYGIHHLFNIVTNVADEPDAILIRAVEPLEGESDMLLRRKMHRMEHRLTAGPGSAAKALGITKQLNGTDLTGNTIWLEDHNLSVPETQILASPRVGIDYAEEDALLPWRFRIKDNPWTSKAK
ncbi:MAG: DNA-3-methyladenine glycosylase [Bacteroidota bacterium]